jgi:hypothetical protein
MMNIPGMTPAGNAVDTGALTSWETNARKVSPLTLGAVEEEELPQERAPARAQKVANPVTARFNNETPKTLMEINLGAENKIITEPISH